MSILTESSILKRGNPCIVTFNNEEQKILVSGKGDENLSYFLKNLTFLIINYGELIKSRLKTHVNEFTPKDVYPRWSLITFKG